MKKYKGIYTSFRHYNFLRERRKLSPYDIGKPGNDSTSSRNCLDNFQIEPIKFDIINHLVSSCVWIKYVFTYKQKTIDNKSAGTPEGNKDVNCTWKCYNHLV